MRATRIPQHENSLFTNKKDSDGILFELNEQSIRIPNSEEVMHFVKCRRDDGVRSYYYDQQTEKTQIVLHFTAGYLKSDLRALTIDEREVSTAFLIPRNGKILNLFPWEDWSYHLGPGAVGGNTNGSKRTIGIELSNIGYLKKVGDQLVSHFGVSDVYCSMNETEFYTKLETPFRKFEYYATYTNEQYESLIVLLRFLTNQFDIPREFLPEEIRYITGTVSDVPSFKGITSHINYRVSDKWDIGPAFDWNRVISGLQA
jgi:N-acetyl-anhydromuramyl-L-alanine amidase AmpD